MYRQRFGVVGMQESRPPSRSMTASIPNGSTAAQSSMAGEMKSRPASSIWKRSISFTRPILAFERPHRKVAHRGADDTAVHLLQRFVELDEVHAPELQRVLVRLVCGAFRIVDVRRPGVLDVRAEDVRHDFSAGEVDEALDAVCERRRVAHVKAAGIQRVAGQQDARAAIIDGDGGRLVARNRDDVDRPAAEVVRRGVLRPRSDREELLQRFGRRGDERGVERVLELGIAGGVIAVAVGVHDEQRKLEAAVGRRPVRHRLADGVRHVRRLRSGVHEEGAPAAEEEIEERLLEIRAARLAEDHEVVVVLVGPEHRRLGTRRGGRPGRGEHAALDAVDRTDLRGNAQPRQHESAEHGLTRGTSYLTFVRKYSSVFTRPSSSGTCGSHRSTVRARVMSGWRTFGSSVGSGLWTILLFEAVILMIVRAISSIVVSRGLPMFTGSVSVDSISLMMPSTRSVM